MCIVVSIFNLLRCYLLLVNYVKSEKYLQYSDCFVYVGGGLLLLAGSSVVNGGGGDLL